MTQKLVTLMLVVAVAGCDGLPMAALGPSASAEQVEEMMQACGFVTRDVRPQVPGDEHLVVNIWADEPDGARKRDCLRTESNRRGVVVGIAGPSGAPPERVENTLGLSR